MKQIINAALDNRWGILQSGMALTTPDNAMGSPFSIGEITGIAVEVITNGGTAININRQAFEAVLEYLAVNGHTATNACQIGSDKSIGLAGPLCVAARNANGSNVMIISYLLPLLARMGLVGIDGSRPNTSWLR